jgi:hypothetical protein
VVRCSGHGKLALLQLQTVCDSSELAAGSASCLQMYARLVHLMYFTLLHGHGTRQARQVIVSNSHVYVHIYTRYVLHVNVVCACCAVYD